MDDSEEIGVTGTCVVDVDVVEVWVVGTFVVVVVVGGFVGVFIKEFIVLESGLKISTKLFTGRPAIGVVGFFPSLCVEKKNILKKNKIVYMQ